MAGRTIGRNAAELPQDCYRVREALISAHYGSRTRMERRFLAERRIVAFGFNLFWFPVLNSGWREAFGDAVQDALCDYELRTRPLDIKILGKNAGSE